MIAASNDAACARRKHWRGFRQPAQGTVGVKEGQYAACAAYPEGARWEFLSRSMTAARHARATVGLRSNNGSARLW